jgi:hypothetical protein
VSPRVLGLVTTFSTKSFKGTPLRARRAADLGTGPEHQRDYQRGADDRAGGPPPGAGVGGALAAGRRQPGPLPPARQRTGAGRSRNVVSPAPASWRSPPSRTPQ